MTHYSKPTSADGIPFLSPSTLPGKIEAGCKEYHAILGKLMGEKHDFNPLEGHQIMGEVARLLIPGTLHVRENIPYPPFFQRIEPSDVE